MMVAGFARAFDMGLAEVLNMPMQWFFAFLEVKDDVRRAADMRRLNLLLAAGQRSLEEGAFEAFVDELTRRDCDDACDGAVVDVSADPSSEKFKQVVGALNALVMKGR